MMSNPYTNTNFFQFFWVLAQRLFAYITGQLLRAELTADAVQLLVLAGVAISGAITGTFLILRRMTMLANSLSHTILLGIVIAFILTQRSDVGIGEHPGQINIGVMLLAAVITGLITAFLTEFLTKTVRLQADASTGLVFTTLFALGVTLVTLFTRNVHIGAEVVMGNVDALHPDDCQLIAVIVALNVVLVGIFYRGYKITTFDPQLAQALGFCNLFLNYLLMIQVSTTCVGAFRAVGVLMVLAFITGPALTARLLTHRLSQLLVLAVLLGSASAVIGVALSRHILTVTGQGLSTSGLVVCVIVAMYAIVAAATSMKRASMR